jgi:hypothetical protein
MTTIAITGINRCFTKTVLPKLQADGEIEKIIGIDMASFKGSPERLIREILQGMGQPYRTSRRGQSREIQKGDRLAAEIYI